MGYDKPNFMGLWIYPATLYTDFFDASSDSKYRFFGAYSESGFWVCGWLSL